MSEGIRRVGFIGLGKIGSALARNVLKGGFDLTVYNRTQSKMKPFTDSGAKGATSLKDLASDVEVVITNLTDDKSVLEIVSSPDGILAGMKPGGIHIGTTTISPGCATKLAELHAAHGSHYVAGPVIGRPDQAEAGQMVGYCAGDPDVVERCAKVFASYCRSNTYVSAEHAAANSVKILNNFMAISIIEMFGEVYAAGEKCGIDSELLAGLMEMILAHPAMKQYVKKVRTRSFDDVGFTLSGGFKDVQLMLQLSTDRHAPLPYASLIRDKFVAAFANGLENKDWSSIYEITRMNAGLK